MLVFYYMETKTDNIEEVEIKKDYEYSWKGSLDEFKELYINGRNK